MISIQNVTLRRGKNILLNNINWTIYPKQRIGLVGANGTGKSSLFSLLLNELESESGDVTITPNTKLAHVAQETPSFDESALEFVLKGDEELYALQKDLDQAEERQDGMQI